MPVTNKSRWFQWTRILRCIKNKKSYCMWVGRGSTDILRIQIVCCVAPSLQHTFLNCNFYIIFTFHRICILLKLTDHEKYVFINFERGAAVRLVWPSHLPKIIPGLWNVWQSNPLNFNAIQLVLLRKFQFQGNVSLNRLQSLCLRAQQARYGLLNDYLFV